MGAFRRSSRVNSSILSTRRQRAFCQQPETDKSRKCLFINLTNNKTINTWRLLSEVSCSARYGRRWEPSSAVHGVSVGILERRNGRWRPTDEARGVTDGPGRSQPFVDLPFLIVGIGLSLVLRLINKVTSNIRYLSRYCRSRLPDVARKSSPKERLPSR